MRPEVVRVDNDENETGVSATQPTSTWGSPLVAFSELTVRSSSGSYDVRIGTGEFAKALTRGDDVVVVDAALRHLIPERAAAVISIEASEDAKTLTGCEQLIMSLRGAGVRRGDHVLAVGGGVVQDIATFVTDVYQRGVAWSYVPTTLMAMTDSCIGGKSSINVGEVKNLVGGFHPPEAVIVDPVFLGSLSQTALVAGFAEAMKIAYCRGPATFDGYLESYDRFDVDPTSLIVHVLRAKQWFVEIDEHDQLERRLLNFGHTFGHALESAVDHALSNGLSVAVGVLCAIRHPASAVGPEVDALETHCRSLLALASGVVEALNGFDRERFERAFRADKKHGTSTFRLVLPAPGGGVVEVQTRNTPDEWDVIEAVTRQTLDSVIGRP
jgi:3-dehydroquinate synthase